MAIVKAQVRKQYAIESQMMLRLLASGIKLTDAVMQKMGLKAGIAQEKNEDGSVKVKGQSGDSVHFAYDPEANKTYIFKADEGSVIGATKTFTSSGLKARLLEMASGKAIENGEGTITPATELKGGLQVRFHVASEPIVDGEDKFFEVSFDKAILVGGEEEEEATEAASATSKATADSDWK